MSSQFTRREFIKGAATVAVVGSGTLAGFPSAAGAAPEVAAKMMEADVVVVGLGVAGLSAAIHAAELGAKVIAVEKMPAGDWIGGSMVISSQAVHIAVVSPTLPEAELQKALQKQTWNRPQKPYAEVLNAFAKNVGRCFQWFVKQGIQTSDPSAGLPSLQPAKPRGQPWGLLKPGAKNDYRQYGAFKAAKALEAKMIEKGVQVLYATAAKKLTTNEKGEVVGLVAKDKDGAIEIKAKGVILCTGSFCQNREMSQRYLGPLGEEIIGFGAPGATGDGFEMALEVGAALKNMSQTYWWPEPADAIDAPDGQWHDLHGMLIDVIGIQGIIVNENGERFCDESLGRHVFGPHLFRQGFVKGLMIVDSALYKDPKSVVAPLIDQIAAFKGAIYQADTIADLAKKANVSSALAGTVNEFNKAIDDKKMAELKYPKAANANKIATPPFYGVPFVLGTLFHYGGLMINGKSQVLDKDNLPIPGLWAAGDLTIGSFNGGTVNAQGNHTGGITIGFTFGLISAEGAVERAKART